MQIEVDICSKSAVDLTRSIDFSKAALFCSTKQTKLILNKNEIIRSYIDKQQAAICETVLDLLFTQKDLTSCIVN